jgi:hypothetical protein
MLHRWYQPRTNQRPISPLSFLELLSPERDRKEPTPSQGKGKNFLKGFLKKIVHCPSLSPKQSAVVNIHFL